MIPPLSLLPEPDRMDDLEDGWTSRIWDRRRGSIRIRSRGSSCVYHEFEWTVQKTPIRRYEGDIEFAVKLAENWLKNNPWED